ncbi:MAG: hypothetical protein IJ832_05005, partial [Bacteroidaceae bacterium]|nr:hypothetical protein [Bacteroidaceae bacterium]
VRAKRQKVVANKPTSSSHSSTPRASKATMQSKNVTNVTNVTPKKCYIILIFLSESLEKEFNSVEK